MFLRLDFLPSYLKQQFEEYSFSEEMLSYALAFNTHVMFSVSLHLNYKLGWLVFFFLAIIFDNAGEEKIVLLKQVKYCNWSAYAVLWPVNQS